MQTDSEDQLWLARAEDALNLADRRYLPVSIGFLTPHQKNFIETKLKANGIETMFCGGYDGAERTLLICYPEYATPTLSDYITALEIKGRIMRPLSHRDYLGSLLGLGMKREMIGDILTMEDKAIVFVRPEIAGYIIENLEKVGSCSVKAAPVMLEDVTLPEKETEVKSGTVSSLRLDCIVAFVLGVSRGKAADFIRAERVTCNFEKALSTSAAIKEGDLLSVRGFGRFKVTEIGGRTRKDRLRITVERFL